MNKKVFAVAMLCALTAVLPACSQNTAAPQSENTEKQNTAAEATAPEEAPAEEPSEEGNTQSEVPVPAEAPAAEPSGEADAQSEAPAPEEAQGSEVIQTREGFSIREISDDLFDRMKQGNTYKEDCVVPREDLRYLMALHKDKEGNTHQGEMVVHKLIAEDVLDILEQLYDAGYPIERMVLPDNYMADDEIMMRDNNSSSFNFRFISHTTKVSKHGLGMAVDINTLYNPYHKTVTNEDGTTEEVIEPATGEPYLDRTKDFDYKIEKDDLCYQLFIEKGFEWGGEWTDRKDYQHFELPTEITEKYVEQYAP